MEWAMASAIGILGGCGVFLLLRQIAARLGASGLHHRGQPVRGRRLRIGHLRGRVGQPWPRIAHTCALPKFAIVLLGLVYHMQPPYFRQSRRVSPRMIS